MKRSIAILAAAGMILGGAAVINVLGDGDAGETVQIVDHSTAVSGSR